MFYSLSVIGNDILCSEKLCLPSAESFLVVNFVLLSFAILAGVFKGIWLTEKRKWTTGISQ